MILTIKFERKDMAFTVTRNFKIHVHWFQDEIMPRYFVMVLGVIYSFYFFGPMCNSVKRSCDIKSYKISIAYDVWFSGYRPFNMKLATDSALVPVFMNFLWAVYVYLSILLSVFPDFYQVHWPMRLSISKMVIPKLKYFSSRLAIVYAQSTIVIRY